jgi:GNAT superfamily N-acetyltransferase
MATQSARPLKKTDLDPVVAIDSELIGRSRRAYFERSLARALAAPELHAELGVDGPQGLQGFVLGRVVEDEFGRQGRAMDFEMLGVAKAAQGKGLGPVLLSALAAEAKRRGCVELSTTALWTTHTMLRFLDKSGFRLAKRQILERTITYPDLKREQLVEEANEAFPLEFATLTESHIADLARLDRRLTGRDRSVYIRRRIGEALRESSVGASLAATHQGQVVGFVTARVDFGDAGRTEPVAVIDTLGVEPEFAKKGVARALLLQLCMNLHALRVERLETVVSRDDFGLLRFLYREGFEPSQRLPFTLPL